MIKCLPHKREKCSSVPSTHVKKQGIAMCICTPVLRRPRQRTPGAHWPASVAYGARSRPVRRPCLKKKVEDPWPPHAPAHTCVYARVGTHTDISVHSPHMHTCTYTCTCVHGRTHIHNAHVCTHPHTKAQLFGV